MLKTLNECVSWWLVFAAAGLVACAAGCKKDSASGPNWPAVVPAVLGVETVPEANATPVANDESAAIDEPIDFPVETPPAAAVSQPATAIPGPEQQPAREPAGAARVSDEPGPVIYSQGRFWCKVGGAWQIHHEGQWMTWHSYKLQFGTAVEPSAESFQGGCEGGQCGPAAARRFRGRR